MAQAQPTWTALVRRHRMEELWEAYRIAAIVAPGGQSQLPQSVLSEWRWEGKALDSDSLTACAGQFEVPLQIVDGSVVLHTEAETEAAFDALEERVITWLEALRAENPHAFLGSEPLTVSIPESGELPESTAWLERLYEGDFLPREKKPLVADLHRSSGPYLASVDRDPLVILETMSQIATLADGFRPAIFQRALDEGRVDDALCTPAWDSDAAAGAREVFEEALRAQLPDPLHHFAYANSGAEANEKAFSLARVHGPGGKRIIAFEGSFHGRTLVSLYATWNPAKREPYQIEGHEVSFAPFPEGTRGEAEFGADWYARWSERSVTSASAEAPPGLRSEIESLEAIRAHLEGGDVCAVIVEPMQSEGGDNYGTARFYNGLRALTRTYGVPLIFDEVQTGFGLGGTFFWHQRFALRDADGTPDHPDFVVCAKKAQVGVVASAWPDSTPTDGHAASVWRGAMHAQLMADPGPAAEVEATCMRHMDTLSSEMPEGLVTGGRAAGYAFAFDLPTAAIADKIVAQRFYRGAMVYKAGSHTLRYRLSQSFSSAHIGALFTAIGESISAIVEWAGGSEPGGDDLWGRMDEVEVPPWAPSPGSHPTGERRSPAAISIRSVGAADWPSIRDAVMAIEEESYEPERRDDEAFFRGILEADDSIVLVADDADGGLAGFTFATPLEQVRHVNGPHEDAELDRGTTLYSADVTVHPAHRGRGVGLALKEAQIGAALKSRRADGGPRFAFVAGRNRIGHTAEMGSINERFGAYPVHIYSNEYGADDGRALYYRIPLRRTDRRGVHADVSEPATTDAARGIAMPLGEKSPTLRRALDLGRLDPAFLSKMTLSNFITPGFVRYIETLRAHAPAAASHVYTTSCRDEMVDKTVRTLRYHRDEGAVCIGFRGGYFGHTTASARSLTDWTGHPAAPKMGWFDWPLVTHPGNPAWSDSSLGQDALIAIATGTDSPLSAENRLEEGLAKLALGAEQISQIRREAETLLEIERIIGETGATRVLGVFTEGIQERTGETLSDRFWAGLSHLCEKWDVPLVVDETASGTYRTGRGLWRTDSLPVQPDVVLWYPGGQIGQVFVNDRYFLPKPLQLISTWDGDEVSAMRAMWTLRTLLPDPIREMGAALRAGLDGVWDALHLEGRLARNGEGLFVGFDAPRGRAGEMQARLADQGIRVEVGFDDRILLVPPLSGFGTPDVERLCDALKGILAEMMPKPHGD